MTRSFRPRKHRRPGAPKPDTEAVLREARRNALARQQGWDSLAGKLVVTAGLGEMGGAQPLAITMNGGVGLLVADVRLRRLGVLSAAGVVLFGVGSFVLYAGVADPIRISPWRPGL